MSFTWSVLPKRDPVGRDKPSLDGTDYEMAELKKCLVQVSKARGLLGVKLRYRVGSYEETLNMKPFPRRGIICAVNSLPSQVDTIGP